MTESPVPEEPLESKDRQAGYQSPQPEGQPNNVVVPMGNPPGYSGPAAGVAVPPGPFSELVGRQLTSDETTWSMLAHLGGIVLGFIAPLIVMLTKGNESPYSKYHAVEALNFQITVLIGYVIASVLSALLIGFFLFPILLIVNLIFCVMAGIAASKGQTYKYPLSLRLVK